MTPASSLTTLVQFITNTSKFLFYNISSSLPLSPSWSTPCLLANLTEPSVWQSGIDLKTRQIFKMTFVLNTLPLSLISLPIPPLRSPKSPPLFAGYYPRKSPKFHVSLLFLTFLLSLLPIKTPPVEGISVQ